jgi:hypothetical protein
MVIKITTRKKKTALQQQKQTEKSRKTPQHPI